ncbi:MAG: GMC family oxidoreductase [Actinobacteria bacterium]|nr:MAG: GMC family oxidoreductase [Actinomycetota bacterium]TMM10600.1 MAG: GMC family oxidoreductase [Actinomycetota bacterium]
MSEQVDVCIVGSGFGGSITAWRLAELYVAAGRDPKHILVLERGRPHKHTDFKQTMGIDHLSDVYNLTQSSGGTGVLLASGPQGCQVVTASAVGGGSNLYLAASLRAPREIFERRDHRPDDGTDRRMWPHQISRKTLDPFYARVERGLRVNRPSWNRVSKSGGLWAATLNAGGYTCDRVPVAINPDRCVEAKWCHTGCIFGAKNTVNTNYLASARLAGVRVRPNRQVESIDRASTPGYRYLVNADVMDNDGPNPTRMPNGQSEQIECKVLVMSAGAMGNPPILMRSQQNLPSLSSQLGKNLGVNGDHVAAIEYNPAKVRSVLGLPGYGQFYKGKPITTMTYDFWVGRRAHRYDGTRFTLQEIFLSSLTNFLYDDGRAPEGEPSWWGLQKKHAIAHWNNRIELLAMVEDTHDGTFLTPPPQGDAVSPNAGPVKVGIFSYELSEQSVRVRELANQAMKQIAGHSGLGRFMKLTETRGVYCAHPLGGCRMAESKDLGVVSHWGEAFDNEGLFCIDSSAVPTSLGVNPSLTISAVSERAADHLTLRGHELGLPARPKGFRHRTPAEHVGERVIPKRHKRSHSRTHGA